jgi:hypothetical protein
MTTTPSQNIYSSAIATSPAICIPRVFPNITERRIAAIFQKLGLGELVRIDMVHRTSETGDFYRVFIHLAWGNSQNAVATRAKLEQPNGEVKVVYDDPWFWKLRASNSKGRHVRVARPEPFIDFNAVAASSMPTPTSSSGLQRTTSVVTDGEVHEITKHPAAAVVAHEARLNG